jgi:signal transduction histidine kinase/ActR/RegA family two-component response regulator
MDGTVLGLGSDLSRGQVAARRTMSMHPILQGAAIGGYLFILGLIYGRWRLTAVHKAFLAFLWAALGWASVTFFLSMPVSQGHELLAKHVGAVFWIPLNFWVLRFTYVLLGRKRDAVYFGLGVMVPISLALYLGTDLALAGVKRYEWGVAAVRGPLHLPIVGMSALCALVAFANMVAGWRRATSPAQRKPLALMILGSGLAIIAAFTANLVMPVFFGLTGFPELGSYAVFLLSPFLYLAIVRYDFLRIRVPLVAEDLFQNSADGILLIDAEGQVSRSNPAARSLLSMEVDGLAVERLLQRFHLDKRGGEHLHVGDGDGRRVLQLSRTTQIRYGADVGQILVLRDVTAQKRAEEVLRKSRDRLRLQVKERTEELVHAQKMEAIGTIAGGFAHDFNNLLAAIVGFATASKSDLPEGHCVQGDLDEILLAANRGRSIVKQLMSISRRRPPHRSVVEGARAVAEVIKLLEVSTPANVTLRFIEKTSHAVRADPSQLGQVLLNMATNSFQAMAAKGGTLKLEVDVAELQEGKAFDGFQRLPEGNYLQITVSDDGPGMLPEVAKRAFDPFFTTKPAEEGTGLGLATARRIVKEHGGAIVLETAPGKGCTARIYLPCAEGSVRDEHREEPAVPTGTERIWFVDDAEQVTRAASRMLEPLGYCVRTFCDPEEALTAFKESPEDVDLLFTDQAMPHLSGTELAEAMLAIRPELPILLVTGYAVPRERVLAEHVGIRSVLFKPLDRAALATAVRYQLDAPAATGTRSERPLASLPN